MGIGKGDFQVNYDLICGECTIRVVQGNSVAALLDITVYGSSYGLICILSIEW